MIPLSAQDRIDAERWRAFCECADSHPGGFDDGAGEEYFTCDVRIPNLDYRGYDSFTKAIDAYIARKQEGGK
jgi:hypothetical protein